MGEYCSYCYWCVLPIFHLIYSALGLQYAPKYHVFPVLYLHLTTIAGIGVIVAGFFAGAAAPLVWLAGGALVLGGLIGVAVFSRSLGDAQKALANTKSAIKSLTDSQTQLTDISNGFDNLTAEYAKLNSFWGAMKDLAEQCTDLEKLGVTILEDPSSITAAQEYNKEIKVNLEDYLRVLNSQGIIEPDDDDDDDDNDSNKESGSTPAAKLQTMTANALHDHIERKTGINEKHRKTARLNCVTRLIKASTESLKEGDEESYFSLLEKAVQFSDLAHRIEFVSA